MSTVKKTTNSPEQEKADREIRSIYAKLVNGKTWKEIEKEPPLSEHRFSRQWFAIQRKRLGLPPPVMIWREAQNQRNPPKEKMEVRIARRKSEGWLLLDEAAERLGITTGVLAFQVRAGKIEYERDGHRIFIPEKAIDKYAAKHSRRSTKEAVNRTLGEEMMTILDCAEKSDKSNSFIYAEVRHGKLPCVKIGSRIWIKKSDFEYWSENRPKREGMYTTDEEIAQTYRRLVEGERWEDLPLSGRISYKGFNARRTRLHLPSINDARQYRLQSEGNFVHEHTRARRSRGSMRHGIQHLLDKTE